jgi:hypothetical protein
MKILILPLLLLLIACSTSKNIPQPKLVDNFSTKNDTIFYKSEPAGLVVHYGFIVDKNNNTNQIIVVKDISPTEDVAQDMISFIHKLHPTSLIEYRNK